MIVAAAYVAPTLHFPYGGRDRTYHVYRPANLNRSRVVPLVVVLHGGFGTGAQAERSYGWDRSADRHGFVVVYPDGVSRSWNAGTCCGPAMRDHVDDVGFLSALIRSISAYQNIDTDRVAITGMSNGAIMAYRMACESNVHLRAIGSVSGTMLVNCVHPQKTSVVEIHGTADKNIPYDGGLGAGPGKIVTPPISDVVTRWRNIDDCGAMQLSRRASVTTEKATCPNDATVELISIAGAGHQWPGGSPPPAKLAALARHLGIPGLDTPSTALNATQTLYTFFFGSP